jgi:hypothetical protein
LLNLATISAVLFEGTGTPLCSVVFGKAFDTTAVV